MGKKKAGPIPGTSWGIIKRIKPDDVMALNKERQSLYQSGVGSLLYLLKHSRPELSNPIRELSKAMSGANQQALQEMFKVIRWVLATYNVGLHVCPKCETDDNGNIIWKLWGICDATLGSDSDDGHSVTGYALYFMDTLISWKSKTQTHVMLSSTEA